MLDPAAIRGMVAETLATFGSIEVAIHNAGIQHVAPVEAFPEDKWDAILAINLTAAFHITKAVWPAMQQKGFGRIINIASAHGLFASPFKSAYVAAKHGLVGFTKTLALEGAPLGITAKMTKTALITRARRRGHSPAGGRRARYPPCIFPRQHAGPGCHSRHGG